MSQENHGGEDLQRLVRWLDAEARRFACASLGCNVDTTPSSQAEALEQSTGGDAERLLALLRAEDLVAIVRNWWFLWDDLRAHLLGVRDASLEELRAAVRRLVIEDWEPRRKTDTEVPGTPLTLCWYEPGRDHAGEFDDDDGAVAPDAPGHDELADEAIYTIIAPELLDGHERTGIRFEEGRPWVAGARYFEQARKRGQDLVVVFADSRNVGWLVGWSVVRQLTVDSSTVCVTGPIVRMRRRRADSVRKLSDGEPLGYNYIRPYVPCHCPSFVRRTYGRLRELQGGPSSPTTPPVESPRESRSSPRVTATAAQPQAATPTTTNEPLLAFSWGYEGWGNHTAELVKMVDDVEASRGFGPPVFVDVRLRRQVRALGFRERAFEKLLGPDRYVWLPGLGNRAIADRSQSMALADPAEARTLHDLVTQRAAAGSRVIFFCSCGSPLLRAHCHRDLVVKELVKVARKRHTPLAVQEWPGGSACVTDLTIPADRMARLRVIRNEEAGRMRLPVSRGTSVVRAAALPHFSLLRCRTGNEQCIAASGPAILTPQGWMFPVHAAWSDEELSEITDVMDNDLARARLLPHGADLPLPPRWRLEPLT